MDKPVNRQEGNCEMNEQIEKLKRLNGELCAEVNEKGKRIRELEAENYELRGYVSDFISCLDEIYKPANVEVVRGIIDYCEDELGIEVNK